MTPDQAMAELVKMFSAPPQPRGKDRHQHLRYIPVQSSDGVIEFIRDPFNAEMERIFAEVVDELLGRSLRKALNRRGAHPSR
jgi:hypothetical protein